MCIETKNSPTDELIKAIKRELTDNQPVASYLIDILPIGREAVYRRIRGEIPFTMPEIMIIANELNISIDSIINNWNIDKVSFDLNMIDDTSPLNNYIKLLERQILMLERLKLSSQVSLKAAFNSIPYSFFLNYDSISKFQLYKYIFHVQKTQSILPFEKFEISDEITSMQIKCRNSLKRLHKFQYILDQRLFIYLAEDVAHFYKMKLITTNEKSILKKEIISLINDLETISITGLSNETGRPVEIFLSNIHFDSSYIFYESEEFEIAHFRLFTINGIRSDNSRICEKQKRWLESLRQSSTCITLSNAVFRKKYFKDQEALINKILK